jgi:hypothetical protein
VRDGLRKLKVDREKWEANRQPSFVEQITTTIETIPKKKQLSIEEAVPFIERAWIFFRNREDAKKMREMLKSVPYECRRSYVKYFDLKFKTIKLMTDVETFSKTLPRK